MEGDKKGDYYQGSFCYQCYQEGLLEAAEEQKRQQQRKRMMELEVDKIGLELKLESWENKLSRHLEEAMDDSISPEKEELIKEKIKNLLGILIGCQQEIATAEAHIKQEAEDIAKEEATGPFFDESKSLLPRVEHTHQSIFYEDRSYPGILFFERAVQESITDQGLFVDYQKQLGITIWFPDGCVPPQEVANVTIQLSFSGTFAGPIDYDPVSPAYLVKTEKARKFLKPVLIKIQHNASIESSEEIEELAIMRAQPGPHHRGTLFGPLYIFYPVDPDNSSFSMEDKCFGELRECRVDNWFMVWRKRKKAKCLCQAAAGGHEVGKYLYSARVYKGDIGFRNRAVFCMCQQHPQYTKHCDEVITRNYSKCGMSGHSERRVVKDNLTITKNDEIVLEGTAPSSLVIMDNDTITRAEIDLPRIANMSRNDFPDYPTRVHIHVPARDPETWTLNIMGLTEVVEFTLMAGYETEPEKPLSSKSRKDYKMTSASTVSSPSLKTLSLIRWRDANGYNQHFSLIRRVGVEWRVFGKQLNIAGAKLDLWEHEYANKSDKCWKKVMNHWLKGKASSEYPVSWQGLDVLLKDLRHVEVAELLKRAVGQVSTPSSSS